MPSSVNPAPTRTHYEADMMGGCTPREQELPVSTDPLVLKKRKREVEEQGKESTANICYSDHFNQKLHQQGREVFPAPTKLPTDCSRATCLRPRLQPVPLKRRRVEPLDQLSLPIPSKLYPGLTPPQSETHELFSLSDSPISTPRCSSSTNLQSFQKQRPHTQQGNNPTTTSPSKSATGLSPCHICHRRPTTRSVLDAYADCSLCGRRTCYICLRECLGPHCRKFFEAPSAPRTHSSASTSTGADDTITEKQALDTDIHVEGRKICSSCAVEGFTEYGEDIVWCLDCVERDRCEMETGGL
ncbi:hypothetical protein VTO42DRAFT_6531 [Malbranchea cinnamomea]